MATVSISLSYSVQSSNRDNILIKSINMNLQEHSISANSIIYKESRCVS